jgi:hypothetical protein
MPPNAAHKMNAREKTRPCPVPPPAAEAKRARRRPSMRPEPTTPFGTELPKPRESDIREIARAPKKPSYRPPVPLEPVKKARTSVTPKARISLAEFQKAARSSMPPAVPNAKKEKDATPTGPRPVARIPSPPPVPREAVFQMQTTELPLEEIDYDAAYAYDTEVLEARLKSKSIAVDKLVAVATGVRASVAPEGRKEAKKELRDMRRASMSGLALLFRKAADLLEAYA